MDKIRIGKRQDRQHRCKEVKNRKLKWNIVVI